MTNPEETKERFYADLEVLIASVPKEDKLIILVTLMPELVQTARRGKESSGKTESAKATVTDIYC